MCLFIVISPKMEPIALTGTRGFETGVSDFLLE